MSVYLNYHYPKGTKLLNQIGNLNNSNHNKGKINKNNFWKQYSNDVSGITGKAKTSIIPAQNPNIYNNDKYNSDINNNYNYNFSNYNNNHGLASKHSNKKELANSVNPYYDTRKLSYNDNDNNNDINNNNIKKNNNNRNLESIILSRVGLQNIGNTCFMNTSLQILIHSEDFIKRLLKKYPNFPKKSRITQNFFHLCESIASSQNLSSITPSDFKYQFGSSHSLFRGYGQNDTQEFFRILLEDMNKELNEVAHKAPYKELDTSKSKQECDKEYDKLIRSRESSIVMDSFYGQIINIFTCKCGKISYSFEKILDLPLLLNKRSMYLSIEQLLDDYFQEEEIYFEAKCEECKKKRYHTKKVKFSQPPNILILSLQRINWKTKRKNDCMVDFSEQLYIKQYIDEECGHGNEYKYSLYAIGNHSGSINFGHYYAYIKLNDTTWYEFNDSTVRKLGNIKTRSSAAYTLFYKKII